MTVTSNKATAPHPNLSGFPALKEKLLNPDGSVARVEQRSRNVFLGCCTLFNLLLLIGSTLLMIYVQQPAAGRAVFVATRVLGYSGIAASVCLGNLLAYLWYAVETGDRHDQRMIDSLMHYLSLT